MPLKTKILGLFLLTLIVLPAILNPVSRGNVLGVSDRASSNSTQNNNGNIAGGVIENRLTVGSSSSSSELKGFAVLDLNAKNSVNTNKFALASEVKVKYNNIEKDLVITSVSQDVPEGALILVNKEVFISLGGNPEKETQIEVSISN